MNTEVSFWLGVALGICIASFSGVVTYDFAPGGAVAECEATLPRNQHCILIAVPEQSGDE